MKIYIAGRIRGNEHYIEQFGKAEEALKAQGHIVLNPAHNPEGMTRLEYMKIDIPLLSIADTIYLLKGWQQSEGACLERHYAEYTGKAIVEEEQLK
ncbi:MAG: DUF4406 domain-containing protein [Clostridia bacterium]|nr:DUF4406 domain-containing protein [Clostridia bacterium]